MAQSSAQLTYQIAAQHAGMVKSAYGNKSEQYDKALAKQIEAEEKIFEWGEEVLRNRPEWAEMEPVFYVVEPEQVARVIRLLMALDASELVADEEQAR